MVMHLACVNLHMSMPEALAAATINAAAALGLSEDYGSLEEGKWADMIIINANKWVYVYMILYMYMHVPSNTYYTIWHANHISHMDPKRPWHVTSSSHCPVLAEFLWLIILLLSGTPITFQFVEMDESGRLYMSGRYNGHFGSMITSNIPFH